MSSGTFQGSELAEEITELREEVLTYKPGDVSTCADSVEFPKKLYIGLFGRTGCGKTSLINSIKSAVHGKLRRSYWEQAAGQEKAGGQTLFRKLADITKHIYVIDNRGLDAPTTDEAIAELSAQLDGRRSYDQIVDWQEASNGNDTDDLYDEDLDLKKGHPIGCAVFVLSALHDIETNTTGIDEVMNFLHSHQGRYPMAIITHVDVAEKKSVEDLITVLKVFGVSDIFEVANLTTKKKLLEESYQHSLLSLLERCMTDGDETLIFKHYQRKEQRRKKEIEKRREEKRRKQEEARIAEECRQMAAKERVEKENQMRRELEEEIRAIQGEWEMAQNQARERRGQEMRDRERERREQEMREQERDRREQERREQERREQDRREQERERREQERREQERERREQDRRELERERREQERREHERDRRYDGCRMQAEKQADIRRIMEANRKDDNKCKMM